jgi:hypothetical protein
MTLASPRPGARPLDPTPFGCNCHLARDESLAALVDAGVRFLRFDIDWDHIEPQRDVFDWTELDRCVDTAARLGASVYATPAYTPEWASGVAGQRAAPPRDGADFVRFVRAVVRRYPGKLHALGIWNEPNLREFYRGTQRFYLEQLLRPGLAAIREEAPEITTCGPDLSSSKGVRDWLDGALTAAGDLMDVLTHHQYDGGDTPEGRARAIDDLRAFLVQRGFGDRPLWITETGWKRGPRVSLSQQADHLRGVLRQRERRATWWTKTFWYDSHGEGWGLFASDGEPDAGRPRPAFAALRESIRELQPLPLDPRSLRAVVERAYLGLLARPADEAGRDAYVQALRRGVSTETMCAELVGSDEWRRTRAALPAEIIAAQLYRGLLGREGAPAEIDDVAAAVRAGRTAARAAAALQSPEFRERFLRPGRD